MKTARIFCYVPSQKGWKNVTVEFIIHPKPFRGLYQIVSAQLTLNGLVISPTDLSLGNPQRDMDQLIDKADKKDYREYLIQQSEFVRPVRATKGFLDHQRSPHKRATRTKAKNPKEGEGDNQSLAL